MAKAKSGGTRSYLRGRIANDVYSIGKDSKGKKQQVVRSLAETVANPQTVAQMRGRMIMSTVMQAVSGLAPYIDHSFDNVSTGQPSISEFIRRNYALIKSDVAAHPSDGNSFFLNNYQQKGIQPGKYQISFGAAAIPGYYGRVDASSLNVSLPVVGENKTAAEWREALAMGSEDYFTLIGVTDDGKVVAARLHPSASLSDDTVITSENVKQLFSIDFEGGSSINVASSGSGTALKFELSLADSRGYSCVAVGVIYSKKANAGYEHSEAVMVCAPEEQLGAFNTASEALPSYPTGTERFLNGGDL